MLAAFWHLFWHDVLYVPFTQIEYDAFYYSMHTVYGLGVLVLVGMVSVQEVLPAAELVAGPSPEDAAYEDATHVAALNTDTTPSSS